MVWCRMILMFDWSNGEICDSFEIWIWMHFVRVTRPERIGPPSTQCQSNNITLQLNLHNQWQAFEHHTFPFSNVNQTTLHCNYIYTTSVKVEIHRSTVPKSKATILTFLKQLFDFYSYIINVKQFIIIPSHFPVEIKVHWHYIYIFIINVKPFDMINDKSPFHFPLCQEIGKLR